MIQDIFPHNYDNQYRQVPMGPDSFIFYFEGDAVLVGRTSEGEITYPCQNDLVEEQKNRQAENSTYLFSIDERAYFLASEVPKLDSKTDVTFSMEKIGIFREEEPLWQCFAGITAHQLKNWYEVNRFCGRCGSVMEQGEKERVLCCDSCGNRVYPKISPAVIVGVIDPGKTKEEDRLLLTKYSGRNYKRYALIAGFTEIGESVEETVRREVLEEVGVHVKNIIFYKSQPWSFSDTLLMGFWCELDGSDEIHLDTEELSVGEWLHRDEIPETSGRISLTGEMITLFRDGKR